MYYKPLIFCMLLIFSVSCSNKHFIKDPEYRLKLEAQFQKQKEIAENRGANLFGILNEELSIAEKEAIQFLCIQVLQN